MAVQKMIDEKTIDLLIIVWSQNSSNSNKLKNIWEKNGIKSILIDKFEDLDLNILKWIKNIWISSGASVSSELVQNVIENLEKMWAKLIEEIKIMEEKIDFAYDLELN
jgi:4-hydroxy-3-methylbut-2-enyl diphosphate reductase